METSPPLDSKLDFSLDAIIDASKANPTNNEQPFGKSRSIGQTGRDRRREDNSPWAPSVKCDNCSHFGHYARNCPQPTKCYACGDTGHTKAECPSAHKTCDLCGKRGHIKYMCRQANSNNNNNHGRFSSSQLCSRCNMPGHLANQCTMAKRCYACGSTTHQKFDCPHLDKTCDLCFKTGHLRAMCRQAPPPVHNAPVMGGGGIFSHIPAAPQAHYGQYQVPMMMAPPQVNGLVCDNCQQVGHRARECNAPSRCYACGSTAHSKAECDKSGMQCNCCGKTGHLQAMCRNKDYRPQEYRPQEYRPQYPTQSPHHGGNSNSTKSCYACGSYDHIKMNCPNLNKTCDNCGKTGHLKATCRNH